MFVRSLQTLCHSVYFSPVVLFLWLLLAIISSSVLISHLSDALSEATSSEEQVVGPMAKGCLPTLGIESKTFGLRVKPPPDNAAVPPHLLSPYLIVSSPPCPLVSASPISSSPISPAPHISISLI